MVAGICDNPDKNKIIQRTGPENKDTFYLDKTEFSHCWNGQKRWETLWPLMSVSGMNQNTFYLSSTLDPEGWIILNKFGIVVDSDLSQKWRLPY